MTYISTFAYLEEEARLEDSEIRRGERPPIRMPSRRPQRRLPADADCDAHPRAGEGGWLGALQGNRRSRPGARRGAGNSPTP
jgi:hypothetical protein